MTKSAAEGIKEQSRHLRGTLAQELTEATDSFSKDGIQLLKFHGVYQQDNRDIRRERTQAKAGLDYSCMVRCSVPGGVLSAQQWEAIDALADEVSDGSLRLTTRQGVQYHFVHKGDLQQLIGTLNRNLVTTYAACGDVNRNVMASTAPVAGRNPQRISSIARALANRFRPRSESYWELWVDGERALSSGPIPTSDHPEPIYGDAYLPRKFKIGIAWPGDNSVDVYSHDVGMIPVERDGVEGVIMLVGGGLGRSHKDPSTYPRLGTPLAWVADTDIPDTVEAVITLFRDFGDRENRTHARLKYVVEERGIEWVRAEISRRLDTELQAPGEIPEWTSSLDYHGWHEQADDTWFLGLPVPSARLADTDVTQRRRAVKEILNSGLAEDIRITPRQDLLLCGISTVDKERVEKTLVTYNVPMHNQLSLSVRSTMACPALPTCGQALGEAERVLPDVANLLDSLLHERGLGDVRIETRMTGCGNGCSRPYVAELGIVGRSKNTYDLFLGGDPYGTRLAQSTAVDVPYLELGPVLGLLLDRFGEERLGDESFGAWSFRIGQDALRADLPSFERLARVAK